MVRNMRKWGPILIAGVVGLTAACDSEDTNYPPPRQTDVDLFCEDEPLPAVDKTPSWDGEVDALLAENCVTCHQTGGIAPMALDTPEEAAKWSDLIAMSVRNQTMPP